MMFTTSTLLLAALSPVISLGFVYVLVSIFRIGVDTELLQPQTK